MPDPLDADLAALQADEQALAQAEAAEAADEQRLGTDHGTVSSAEAKVETDTAQAVADKATVVSQGDPGPVLLATTSLFGKTWTVKT